MIVRLAGNFELTDEQKKVLTDLGATFEDREPTLYIRAYEGADIWDALPDMSWWTFYSNLKDYAIHPSEEKYERGVAERHKGSFVFPIYAYIHSGIALSLDCDAYPFNDKWDAGLAGFAVTSGDSEEEAKQKLQEYIDAYNDVVGSGLYSVYIVDEFGNEVDSLGEMTGSQVRDEAEKRKLRVIWE